MRAARTRQERFGLTTRQRREDRLDDQVAQLVNRVLELEGDVTNRDRRITELQRSVAELTTENVHLVRALGTQDAALKRLQGKEADEEFIRRAYS
jgi:hypothetical protein